MPNEAEGEAEGGRTILYTPSSTSLPRHYYQQLANTRHSLGTVWKILESYLLRYA